MDFPGVFVLFHNFYDAEKICAFFPSPPPVLIYSIFYFQI